MRNQNSEENKIYMLKKEIIETKRFDHKKNRKIKSKIESRPSRINLRKLAIEN